jgi:hypothetical protein
MVKSEYRLRQILYDKLDGSLLKETITGKIYKNGVRPAGSTKEDIVINVIVLTSEQFQRGIANVNLYVPDITVNLEGKQQLMPDSIRLAHLAELALPIFLESASQEYAFDLGDQHELAEPETKQHYINLRIDFQFFPS